MSAVRYPVLVLRVLLVLFVAAGPLTAVAERWGPGVDGVCQRIFESDADRGVRATANGLTLPFRALSASLQGDWKTRLMLPFSFAASIIGSARSLGTGVFDLVTLGFFRFSDADHWDTSPVLFMPVREPRFGDDERPTSCSGGTTG